MGKHNNGGLCIFGINNLEMQWKKKTEKEEEEEGGGLCPAGLVVTQGQTRVVWADISRSSKVRTSDGCCCCCCCLSGCCRAIRSGFY